MGSKRFTLNSGDVGKILLNALFVGLAAMLTYIGNNIVNLDWGTAMIMIPVLSTLIDAAVKFLQDQRTDGEKNEEPANKW